MPLLSGTQPVDRSGNDLFSRSGFAKHEHRGIGRHHLRDHPLTPPVRIEAIRVDGREIPFEALEVLPGRHDVEIDYTATTFVTPERVQFRYRLEGADDAWHDADRRRRAYYTGLAPGQYHFRVAATTGEGEWAEAPTPRTFVILPSWYQTLWARVGIVLLIVGSSAGVASLVRHRRHVR